MALSEYEQRNLDGIERTLHSDDPRPATITDSGVTWRDRRSVAVVILLSGLVGLVGGVVVTVSLPLLGVLTRVVGFVMMATGAWLLGRVRRSRR